MIQECKFCSDCDIQIHVPSLEVDLGIAISTGVIPPVGDISEFNHLDIDTVQSGVRLREVFDAIDNNTSLVAFTPTFSSGTGNITTPSTPSD